MRGINSRFVFSEKDQKRVWKEHMEKTINKEVPLEEITIAKKKMKLGKASGLSEVNMEMINASGKVKIDVMMKLCQRVLRKDYNYHGKSGDKSV